MLVNFVIYAINMKKYAIRLIRFGFLVNFYNISVFIVYNKGLWKSWILIKLHLRFLHTEPENLLYKCVPEGQKITIITGLGKLLNESSIEGKSEASTNINMQALIVVGILLIKSGFFSFDLEGGLLRFVLFVNYYYFFLTACSWSYISPWRRKITQFDLIFN